MSRTRFALIGCGAILVALVTGCDAGVAGSPPPSGADPAPHTSTTPTDSTTPTTTSTTTPTTTVAPTTAAPLRTTTVPRPAGPRRCGSAELEVSLGAEEGTAGTIYRALVFANSGPRSCTIQGFPGVSFVAGDDGHQVGRAAARDYGDKGPVITLVPGGTANAAVGFVDLGALGTECRPTPVRGLRVYPPHNTAAEFVPFGTTACAATASQFRHLTVRAVRPGSGL
jgi:hypothetical protein